MIELGTETLTLPDGTEVDVRIGLGLGITAVRPPASPPPPPAPPTFVSANSPDGLTLNVVFSEAVTWPGDYPDGLWISVAIGTVREGWGVDGESPAGDYAMVYTSGKGTDTLTFALGDVGTPLLPFGDFVTNTISYSNSGPYFMTLNIVSAVSGLALEPFTGETLTVG